MRKGEKGAKIARRKKKKSDAKGARAERAHDKREGFGIFRTRIAEKIGFARGQVGGGGGEGACAYTDVSQRGITISGGFHYGRRFGWAASKGNKKATLDKYAQRRYSFRNFRVSRMYGVGSAIKYVNFAIDVLRKRRYRK